MLRVLASQRILAFTALALLLIPAFLWLGKWQGDRYEQRLAADQLQQANAAADPVPFDELSGIGGDVAPEERWHATAVTGRYDAEHELLVRNRSSDHGTGFHVVTPLVTADGTGVLVNRGWVPRAEAADESPDVPPPPDGEVAVVGRAQVSETEANTGISERDGLPDGQVMLIDVPVIAAELPYPVLGGVVELLEQEPSTAEAPVPVAVDGYNWGLNLAYAVQWWVFAAIAAGAWVVLVRRELRDTRDDPNSRADNGKGTPGSEGAQGTAARSGAR